MNPDLSDIRTEQEHLDLISLHHLVPLELVLNLLIAGLALLVLGTHSTTHFGGGSTDQVMNESLGIKGVWISIEPVARKVG